MNGTSFTTNRDQFMAESGLRVGESGRKQKLREFIRYEEAQRGQQISL